MPREHAVAGAPLVRPKLNSISFTADNGLSWTARLVNTVLVLALGVNLLACQANNPSYLGLDRNLIVEIVKPEDQTLEEVQQTNTTFEIPHSDAESSWERALAYFQVYLSKPDHTAGSLDVGENLIHFNAEGEHGFIYEIERSRSETGYTVNVACHRKNVIGQDPDGLLNARSLARFIKLGKLEATLLSE